MNRQQIDLNEETADAYQLAENRVAKSLLPQAQQQDYQGGKFLNAPSQASLQDERPVRDQSQRSNSKIQELSTRK